MILYLRALPRDNDLLGLFFNGQGSNQGSNFFGGLPLGQLTKTFLTSPYTCVNDLQEKLTSSGVENENGSVDGFGGQVTFKSLVDGHSVDVGVVDKPNNLVTEQFAIIL